MIIVFSNMLTCSILSFFPHCKIKFSTMLKFIIFSLIGFFYLFVIKGDKIWFCALAGLKILVLNVYEYSLWLLESEEERDQEHERRMCLYGSSWVIDMLLLLAICA